MCSMWSYFSDPLDAVFVTGDEAAELKRDATARKLATYIERMPAELRGLFAEQFQHITSAELIALRATVEAQARQLEQAREIIERQYTGNYRSYTERRDDMRAWLDANAPAPQAQQVYPFSVTNCPCVISEHPVMPCSLGCFHFTPDDYHVCANCGQPQAQPGGHHE